MELTTGQQNALDKLTSWNGHGQFVLKGAAGTGKQQPVDCLVHTPAGWRQIGDLKVGDVITDPATGSVQTVTGVFPQGVQPVWEVKFRDGTSTRCGADHLWWVERPRCKPQSYTAQQLSKKTIVSNAGEFNYRVPLTKPVQNRDIELPLPPYSLGVMIGDGALSDRGITISNPLIDNAVISRVRQELAPLNLMLVFNAGSSCPRYRVQPFKNRGYNQARVALSVLGLNVKSGVKFIPPIYKQASATARYELLQGLMDTDGSCSIENSASFSTSSKQLADDVCELVRSLGGVAIARTPMVREGRSSEFVINVKMLQCPFYLPRKAARWSPSRKNPPVRSIVSVEETNELSEQVCISVSGDSKLYLTDHYIVTHNTTVMKQAIEILGNVTLLGSTGKAAVRLQEATGQSATTIHSAIYQPYLKDGELRFGTRTDALMSGRIAIVDEASMVTQWMARDLERCFRGILYIGDHFQLPPVKADDWFGAQAADVELKEVMRQALESPVLSLVTAIRNGLPIPTTCSSDELVIKSTSNVNDLLGVDQVVCATNATRISLNELIRSKLGRTGPVQVGDRLINLRNVPSPKGIVCNGQQGVVTALEGKKLTIQWDDDREFSFFGTMNPEEFESKGAGKDGNWLYLDFAYCITAHKAQGSQWPSVLVHDDSRYMKDPKERRKWQYTALSRAAKRLVWIRKT